jgi:hypothetical protein
MTWIAHDLSLVAGAPYSIGDISGYDFPTDRTMHIVYTSPEKPGELNRNMIHELYAGDDHVWHHTNLTLDSGAETAFVTAHAYVDDTDDNQHAIYLGTTGIGLGHRLKEIYWRSEDKSQNDLSAAAHAQILPAAVPFGCGFGFGAQHIFYMGTDAHLWHLERQLAHAWVAQDLTFTQAAPAADSRPMAFHVPVGRMHIVYRDRDSNLIVVSRIGFLWTVVNLTTKFGVTAASDGAVGMATGVGTDVFIHYRGVDNQLHQVHWTGNADDPPTQRILSIDLRLPPMEDDTEASNYFLPGDSSFHVIYHAEDGTLVEIHAGTSFDWGARNMLAGNQGGEPLAARRAAVVFSRDNTQHIVYSRKSDFHVIELTWQNDDRIHRPPLVHLQRP